MDGTISPDTFYVKYGKRGMDFLLSFLLLIVLSPVLLVLGVLVRIKLGSPVLFCQERPGKNEKIFKLYKFRTMTNDKDKNGKLLEDKARLTKFGITLREASLDELPELINIMMGDMSFVGPRPLLIKYLPYYTPKEKHRHDVKPGLTGLAQINGRNILTWEKRLEFDLMYVQDISFLKDISILIKTIFRVLKKEGIVTDTKSVMQDLDDLRRESEL